MDKTRNKIFVGCLALLLVMVVGYALFSQSLNITGTATAKGDFSVTPTCQAGVPDNLLAAAKTVEGWNSEENGYSDDSCTVSGNTVDFKSSFKWPGATRYFTVKVKNTGSVTAVPTDVSESAVEFCNDANGNDTFDADECFTDKNSLSAMNLIFDHQGPVGNNLFAIEKKDGTVLTVSEMGQLTEEEQSEFLTSDGELKMDPGVTFYYLARLGVKSTTGSEEGGKMMMKGSYSTKFTFSQPASD